MSCAATDAHGNHGSASFTVTVTDTTGPVVTVPANAIVEATSAAGAVFTFSASAIDVLDGAIATLCSPASGSPFAFGPTTVNCAATDTHGNHGSASFIVTVRDTTSPVVTVPANAAIEATSTAGAVYTFAASATDTFDGSIAVTCVPASGSIFPLGATAVTCAADDSHGNRASASFSVSVADTTAPAVTAPAQITVAATQAEGARGNVVGSTASQSLQAYLNGGGAIDSGDAAPARQATQALIDAALLDVTVDTLFPVGTTEVTFRFRDARGNVGTASSFVTVTPPIGGIVVSPNEPVTAANDENVPQPVTVSFATVTQPGLLTATAVMTDSPAAPPDGFRFAAGGVLNISTTALVAPPIEVCIVGGFLEGDRLLHFENGAWADVTTSVTAARACGTVSSLSPFAVITALNHAPSASAGAGQTVEATSAAGAAVTLTATASDVDAGDTLSYGWTEGAVELGTSPSITVGFAIGVHNVELIVTDSQAETATASTSVTVQDSTAPILALPANQSVEATAASGVAFTYSASASDAVDATVAVSCNPTSGAPFPLGPTTVNCTATATHGNHAAGSFVVTVTDTTGPVVTVPVNATVEATGAAGAVYTFTASAADALDGSIATTCTPASGSTFAFGPTTGARRRARQPRQPPRSP